MILEGPSESKDEAQAVVIACMERPFKNPLKVALTVDSKVEQTWYAAK